MNNLREFEDFSKSISGKIFINYNLNKSNWFNLGGPAKVFFNPNSLSELVKFINNFKNTMPIKTIGVGSNILVRDGGFDGIIIKLNKNFSHVTKLNENTIISGTSILDKKLSDFALANNISGFEFLSCIPGTIGGAIRMNSGCYGYNISNCLVSIQALDTEGKVKLINSNKIKFHYRGSDLSRELIFLSATLKGKKEGTNFIKKRIEDLTFKKKQSQPSKIKTCGSTFKNPINQTKKKSWELIKEAGCDKLKIGGAFISEQHCNFFVNAGDATSEDMENLITKVKEKVLKTSGILLDLELEIIGKKK